MTRADYCAPIKGYAVRYVLVGPMSEFVLRGDGRSFSCLIYPGPRYADCEIDGRRVSPLVYKIEKRRAEPRRMTVERLRFRLARATAR